MGRKVVYNACYGGFSLSKKAQRRLYELKNNNKPVYFYVQTLYAGSRSNGSGVDRYVKIDIDKPKSKDKEHNIFWLPLSIDLGDSFEITKEDKRTNSELYQKFNDSYITLDDIERHDPDLIRVVEELGKEANGICANLVIKDIGDSKYHIDEYDGYESVITNLGDDYWH